MSKKRPRGTKLSGKKRATLFKHLMSQFHNKCHWCKCEVVRGLTCGRDTAPDCATIDHLMTMRMGRTEYMQGGHVLSCYLCNQARNILENREYGSKVDIPLDIPLPLVIFDWALQPVNDYTGRQIT